MEPLALPEWAMDLERSRQDMMFGRIPLEFVISQGKIGKVIGTKSHQVKFRDNNEAQIYILDQVRQKLKRAAESDDPDKQSGTLTFSVVHSKGHVKQVNTFDQIEFNY